MLYVGLMIDLMKRYLEYTLKRNINVLSDYNSVITKLNWYHNFLFIIYGRESVSNLSG